MLGARFSYCILRDVPMHQPSRPAALADLAPLVNAPLLVSAAAECLAGALVGGASLDSPRLYGVVLASVLLFAAGALFGHFFDRAPDEKLHPDRPLPSGRIAQRAVSRAGWLLLLTGTAMAPLAAGRDAALAGVGVGLMVAVYASLAKNVWGFGFLTLAAARGLNLLLGLSAGPDGLGGQSVLAVPVLLYAAGWAVTRTARQPGAAPATAFMGLLHVGAGLAVLLYYVVSTGYRLDALPFLLLCFGLALPRFVSAAIEPRQSRVAEAVQYGFLGLTLLEATLAGAFAGIRAGILVAFFCLPLYATLRKWPISLATRRP